jgi:hypothetical protein
MWAMGSIRYGEREKAWETCSRLSLVFERVEVLLVPVLLSNAYSCMRVDVDHGAIVQYCVVDGMVMTVDVDKW